MAQAQSIFIPYIGASDLAAIDYWTASDAIFPAGVDAIEKGVNDHPLVVYAESEDRYVYFAGVMGKDYGGGVITIDIFWISPATGGDVVWFVAWERDNVGQDLTVNSFFAEKSVVSTAPAVGEVQKATLFFTKAEADGVEPGDPFRFRVRRDATVLLDTLAGDAQLFRVSKEALP
jgi:hypothetical protein